MAVKAQTQDDDSDAQYRSTLRDEEFIKAMESHADNVNFNPRTGHILVTFLCDSDDRRTISSEVWDLADRYAYDTIRVNDRRLSTMVVLG